MPGIFQEKAVTLALNRLARALLTRVRESRLATALTITLARIWAALRSAFVGLKVPIEIRGFLSVVGTLFIFSLISQTAWWAYRHAPATDPVPACRDMAAVAAGAPDILRFLESPASEEFHGYLMSYRYRTLTLALDDPSQNRGGPYYSLSIPTIAMHDGRVMVPYGIFRPQDKALQVTNGEREERSWIQARWVAEQIKAARIAEGVDLSTHGDLPADACGVMEDFVLKGGKYARPEKE